jgi:hypothetical protein
MPQLIIAAQAAYAAFASLNIVAQIAIKLAVAAALTAASIAFQDVPRAPNTKRELGRPNSLPPYRFAYGRYSAYGSPAPFKVRGGHLYACLLLNSRPSAGGAIKITFDKRTVNLTGDMFDFAGPGAEATNSRWINSGPFGAPDAMVHAWMGLGDQTGPPAEIVAEAPDLFEATDAWRGRTVLWLRLRSGGRNKRLERWPRVPPEIEVEMDWSKVWDPRDVAQDPDDPDTWEWSSNQALCALDALMRNPVAPYRIEHLDIPSWIIAADVADEPVALKAGGTEPRYRVNGLIDWSSGEVEQLVEPMILAGAGGVTRIGGKLAAIPGAWQEPEVTISEAALEGDLTVEALQPGDDVFSGVKTTYVSPDRDWRPADAGVYRVPGAAALDGGAEKIRTVDLEMVTSPTQAQRIGKILALQGRQQRQIDTTFPPSAFEAVAGGTVTLALPAPFDALDGTFEVISLNPGFDLVGENGGVALRCPGVLRSTAATIWAWNAATDEQDVFETVEFDGSRLSLAMPGTITAISGSDAALGTGGTAQPRIRFEFAPADSDRIESYDVEYRISGGSWQDGGRIDADVRDSGGDVFGFIHPVQVGQSYDVRVRSKAPGDVSDWRTYTGVVALAADVTLDPPEMVSAVGSTGRITVTITSPNADDVRGVQVWVNTVNNSSTASVLPPTLWVGPNRTFEVAETGLTAGTTHHYWAKTVGPYGAVSALSTRVFATAT